jgi:N-acetylglutamate synthase-like GNAT family acetyltransferase
MDGAKSAGGYMLQDLPAGRASYLLFTWQNAAQSVRSNGFNPASEAFGDGADRFKELSDGLPRLVSTAKILALTASGGLNFETLPESHAEQAETLSRTKLVAAISAGAGSAVAFVSTWPDHVSIDACVVNPIYMTASQDAEAELIKHVVQQALAAGISDIRLHPSLQMDGEFYERLGFRAADGEGEDATLRYHAPS